MDSSSSPYQFPTSNIYLQIGGIFSLAFSVFQICGAFMPSNVILYFGGPVKLQAESPALFAILCVVLGMVIAIAGSYALSGAGKIGQLPFLRSVLVAVTTIFILRGLGVIPLLLVMLSHPESNVFRHFFFSLVALCVGVVHLIGIVKLFRQGRPERTLIK